MKKLVLAWALLLTWQTQGQNLIKGVNTSTAEYGTSGSGPITGYENAIFGNNAGQQITTGTENTFLGYSSGVYFSTNSTGNTCVGNKSGGSNSPSNGSENTFIGHESAYIPPIGGTPYTGNTIVGARAGYNFMGNKSTILGANTAWPYSGTKYFGDKLTLIGADARNGTGNLLNNATAIGADAVVSKDDALILGNNAYVGIGTSSPFHTLHIRHLNTWSAYNIYSDSRSTSQSMNCAWDNACFVVTGDYTKAIFVQQALNECQVDGPTQETFHVYGNGYVETVAAYGIISDRRYKKDIKTIGNALELVKALDGVSYRYNIALASDPSAETKPTYGFIAQEVEKVLPDAVFKNKEGFYSLNYDAIIPVLNNAIKEQQKQIEALQQLLKAPAVTTGINLETSPSNVYLSQNTPNPFSSSTDIHYQLPVNSQKNIIGLYDLNGKEIKLFELAPGTQGVITINGGDLQPGMYIYTLISDGKALDSKRMILTSK